MHVAAILKDKGRAVETVTAQATLMDVTKKLSSARIGAVVVIDGAGALVGIISERDIIRVVGTDGPAALEWPVSSVMTQSVMTCRESDSVDKLMSVMTERRFRHLPVVEKGRLAGIISIGDVVKHRVAEVETEATFMRDYITAA